MSIAPAEVTSQAGQGSGPRWVGVIAGQVDALFADHLVCALEVWRHPESGLSALEPPLTIEPLGIAVPPDAPLLLNLVENHLETLDHTGLLASFRARWLADGRWLAEIE